MHYPYSEIEREFKKRKVNRTITTLINIEEILKDPLLKNPKINIIGVEAYGSVLKKYHETREFDEKEIYPYRREGLGKNLIPTATDFDLIDTFVKVTDEESAHTAREISMKEDTVLLSKKPCSSIHLSL